MPKVVNHEHYRQELLSGAFEAFAARGYAAVTMQELAKALGVSTGTLYHYFPNKKALFFSLVKHIGQHDLAGAEMLLKKATTPAERLEAYLEFVQRNESYFINQLLLVADFYQQREAGEGVDILREVGDRYRSVIGTFISSDDPDLIDFAFAYTNGLIVQRMVFGEGVSLEPQAALFKTFMAAFRGEASGRE